MVWLHGGQDRSRINVASVVDVPVARVAFVDRIVIQPAGRLVVSRVVMRRKRQYCAREACVEVAVFLPAVAYEYEVALPAGFRGGEPRKLERYLISRVQDDVAVIDLVQQLHDV